MNNQSNAIQHFLKCWDIELHEMQDPTGDDLIAREKKQIAIQQGVMFLRSALEAPTKRIPENCGSGHCSCVECLKPSKPGLFINMIAQHVGLSEELKTPEPTGHEAWLLHEMRYIAGISNGQVKRVADEALARCADTPFEPDWVNYRQGFAAGKAEAIPEGYVLVPIEPTSEMIVALMCTGLRHAEYKSGCDPTIAHLAQGYTEMLAAAPKGEA